MTKKAMLIGFGGLSVPDNVVDNSRFPAMGIDTSEEWILSHTGILERRHAKPGETTSNFAILAARQALENAGITADQLDLVIVATVTSDYVTPAMASIVQNAIGATHAGAMDVSAGCSGFVYALSLAEAYVATGSYKHVLVIGADCLSKITNWSDRSSCILFGDGAGAVVVARASLVQRLRGYGLGPFVLHSDGSGADKLRVPTGGAKYPSTPDDILSYRNTLEMDGAAVYRFAKAALHDAVLEVLAKAHLKLKNVSLIIPHQANRRIIEAAQKQLGASDDQMYINIGHYGNTSSASVPMAIYEAFMEGRIGKGDIVLVVAFGAGLTSAAGIIKVS